jgi:hypothetical protein
MSQTFDWDEGKAAANLQKHKISFEEARSVFNDPLFISFYDEEHSSDEERFITIGMSDRNRLLLVAHTDDEAAIRIISARKATNQERGFYDEGL